VISSALLELITFSSSHLMYIFSFHDLPLIAQVTLLFFIFMLFLSHISIFDSQSNLISSLLIKVMLQSFLNLSLHPTTFDSFLQFILHIFCSKSEVDGNQ
jgi:multisubunit Na+/H+ antiporter MnhE subunit